MKAQENVFYPMKNKEELNILYTRMIARWSRKHLFQATLFLVFYVDITLIDFQASFWGRNSFILNTR